MPRRQKATVEAKLANPKPHETVHLFQTREETLDQFLVRLTESRKANTDVIGHPRVDETLKSDAPPESPEQKRARLRQQIIDRLQSLLPPDTYLELVAEDLEDLNEDDEFEFEAGDDDESEN